MAEKEKQYQLIQQASQYLLWVLNARQLCDIELLFNGGFSPLTSFLGEKDYLSVLDNMRLANGRLWPIPITLDVSEKFAEILESGSKICLRNMEMMPIAIMTISDIWKPDLKHEAVSLFNSDDPAHSGVDYTLYQTNPVYISGKLQKINFPRHFDYKQLRLSPAEIKEFISECGWDKIIAFQTRNPMHRAHVELTQHAMQDKQAKLLIHPIVGITKPGDINYYTRVKCYLEILKYYPQESVKLALLPLAMRMAGPREAIWHGLIRKNYGCTHIILGRDHAGPGSNHQNKPFYGEYEAQELFAQYELEMNIKMIPMKEMVYSKTLKKYVFYDAQNTQGETQSISGTRMREMLADNETIPEWFTYPEITQEIKKAYPPLNKRGFTVFFTGLSSSGKSTLAHGLISQLRKETYRNITLLDGDIVRRNLSSELGFSKEHRSINVRRIGFVANEIIKNNGIAICAPIAPYAEDRYANRKLISESGGYFEIYVSTPLAVCENRDVKGYYLRAHQNLTLHYTGISDPYEVPENPDLIIDTSDIDLDTAIQRIIIKIKEKKYL